MDFGGYYGCVWFPCGFRPTLADVADVARERLRTRTCGYTTHPRKFSRWYTLPGQLPSLLAAARVHWLRVVRGGGNEATSPATRVRAHGDSGDTSIINEPSLTMIAR